MRYAAIPYARARARTVGSLLSVNLKTKTISQTLSTPNATMSKRRNQRIRNLTIEPP
jgi:hypothetical protein